MQINDEPEFQQTVKWYIRLGVGVGLLVFIFVVWRAMLRLNYKLYLLRDSFWPTIKFIGIIFGIALIGLIVTLAVLNYYAREKIDQEHQENNKQPD